MRTRSSESEPGRETQPQLTFQGRDPTPCPGPETLISKPIRYPFESKTVIPSESRFQFFADVRLGRSRQIVFQFLFAGWVWLRVKTSRDEGEPFSSRPGGRVTRSVAAGGRAQSNPRSPAVPNADRGCSGTSEFGR